MDFLSVQSEVLAGWTEWALSLSAGEWWRGDTERLKLWIFRSISMAPSVPKSACWLAHSGRAAGQSLAHMKEWERVGQWETKCIPCSSAQFFHTAGIWMVLSGDKVCVFCLVCRALCGWTESYLAGAAVQLWGTPPLSADTLSTPQTDIRSDSSGSVPTSTSSCYISRALYIHCRLRGSVWYTPCQISRVR